MNFPKLYLIVYLNYLGQSRKKYVCSSRLVSLIVSFHSIQDLASRVDLRDFCICSIDPPGCTDIDDALHCRLLENGNYEVKTMTFN